MLRADSLDRYGMKKLSGCSTCLSATRSYSGRDLPALAALPCGDSTTFVVGRKQTGQYAGPFAAPCTLEWLGKFQGLQRALNSAGQTVKVDGDIGQQTLQAVQALFKTGGLLASGSLIAPGDVAYLAKRVDDYKAAIDSATGKSSSTAPDPAKVTSAPPDSEQAAAGAPTSSGDNMMLWVLAGAAAVGALALGAKKVRKRRKKK